MTTNVAGVCPSCGSTGLLHLDAGRIRCAASGCNDPELVADFLDAPGPVRHIVTFERNEVDGWNRRTTHTVRCRVHGLAACPVDAVLEHRDAPLGPGTFEVDLAGGSLWFRPICCECGCSWDQACGTGCWWAPDHPSGGPLCSTCADRIGLPTRPVTGWPVGPASIEVPADEWPDPIQALTDTAAIGGDVDAEGAASWNGGIDG